MSLRAIVTQKGCWQVHVSCFLLRHLSSLTLDDIFVRNSEDLVQYLQEDKPGSCDLVLFDVQDMFYSTPHHDLMRTVDERIDTFGSLAFWSSFGIAKETFLELMRFYLMSAFVTLEGDSSFLAKKRYMYSDKRGGVPVLSNIYLWKCDRAIAERLDEKVVN